MSPMRGDISVLPSARPTRKATRCGQQVVLAAPGSGNGFAQRSRAAVQVHGPVHADQFVHVGRKHGEVVGHHERIRPLSSRSLPSSR